MAATTGNVAGAEAIRPFTIKGPDMDLKDLHERIASTRWPRAPRSDLGPGHPRRVLLHAAIRVSWCESRR